ncbi:hypothetical protein [Mucilaginibacter terrae]|uniref:Uncharacterized protein n=1 Tax=Mucilaginibacter terrae TaxID=1955052 RepID=A0ABU3GUV7_9SPHI|nr:hypothetical protein [Mucilaginibacter terrae]MDT3402425.1 hypothetical protein [Mucilaginibacter terrae]
MKLYIPLLVIGLLLFSSCYHEPKIIGDGPLKLDDISFNFSVVRFYDDKDLFNCKKQLCLTLDTVTKDDEWYNPKPAGLYYSQATYSNDRILAKFEGSEFYGLNMVSTLDHKLIAIAAVIAKINIDESKAFIDKTTKKYGRFEERKADFMGINYPVYTWKLKDRILQYSPVLDNEQNALKIEKDMNTGTIKEGKKNPHYKGYFYIIKSGYTDFVKYNVSSGDFVIFD